MIKRFAIFLFLISALSMVASGAEVVLTWQDNSSNEAGFKMEKATGAGSFSQIGTTNANVTTYTDTSVTPGSTYSYRVRSYNSAGDSAYSNTAVVSVPAPVNTAPTISAIANQTVNSGTLRGPLAFTVGDTQTAAGSLVVIATSSNQTLLPNASIVLGGTGANRTISFTTVGTVGGTATITVTVSDGSLTATRTFTVNSTVVIPAQPSGLTLTEG